MKYVDKSTGDVYTRVKCPNCNKKFFIFYAKQDTCPSCGSKVILEKNRRIIQDSLIPLVIGAIIGPILGAFWAISNNRILDLIWVIPLGIIIGAIIPYIIYALIIFLDFYILR